jgi:hypothetical protein
VSLEVVERVQRTLVVFVVSKLNSVVELDSYGVEVRVGRR